jgi:hypothetical protein
MEQINMSTYNVWVAETIAKNSAEPANPRITISTLEFARFQPDGEAQPEERAGLIARLRDLLRKSAEAER